MKFTSILPTAAVAVMMISCANQTTEDVGDVSNPYAAPDYGVAEGSPYAGDESVNPVYDSPAAYSDTAYTPPSAPTPPPTRPAVTRPTVTPKPPVAAVRNHTVVRGDTLWGLSKQYGVSIDAIKQANNMTRDTVVLGSTLQIPAR